ncbi:MAG: hypothetical protein RQ966_14200 [Acetobacteraceae bacterium]|nr:hypothetical protein [Acetobacteraceae bacterium]
MRHLILSVLALGTIAGSASVSPAVARSALVLTAPEVQHVQYYEGRREREEMRRRREIERRREEARRRAEREHRRYDRR